MSPNVGLINALLDPDATLSFVMPYLAMRFGMLLDMFVEPFSISTPLGDFVVAKRVNRRFLVSLLLLIWWSMTC